MANPLDHNPDQPRPDLRDDNNNYMFHKGVYPDATKYSV